MSITGAAPTARAASAKRLPRRRSVARHPGIYYRPWRDGKVAPPYEIAYLDSTGKRRWEIVHGNLAPAEARRAELRLRRRRGERIEPCRQTFAEYAADSLARQTVRPRTLEIYDWALRVGSPGVTQLFRGGCTQLHERPSRLASSAVRQTSSASDSGVPNGSPRDVRALRRLTFLLPSDRPAAAVAGRTDAAS